MNITTSSFPQVKFVIRNNDNIQTEEESSLSPDCLNQGLMVLSTPQVTTAL